MPIANILGVQGLVLLLVLVIFFFGGRLIPGWVRAFLGARKSFKDGWTRSTKNDPKN